MNTPSYWIEEEHKPQIIKLYKEGNSSQEIKDLLKLEVTVRSIQRYIKQQGISRTVKESFQLAIKKGRVSYEKSPQKRKKRTRLMIRYQVLERDNFKCVKCGKTSTQTQIEIDHINEDPSDNRLENLQTLCEWCNKGKYQLLKSKTI